MDLLAADVQLLEDDPATILCSGELDVSTVDLLTDSLLEISESGPGRVVVDFRPVTFVSHHALTRLAREVARCEGLGVVVELDPCPFLERLFARAGTAYVDGLSLRLTKERVESGGLS